MFISDRREEERAMRGERRALNCGKAKTGGAMRDAYCLPCMRMCMNMRRL
jgi:hypothetical protein